MATARPLRHPWAWVVTVVAMLALRDVGLWTHPRFWAEEGLRYFEVAWNRPLLEAALSCPQGYYNLGCQTATMLALLVPLEHAPLVTTAFGLLAQLVPVLLVLRLARRGDWSRPAMVTGMAVTLLAPPLHETWLSSTGSAFYLVLAGALVVLHHERLQLGITACAIAFVAGLSSPYGFSLLPAAVWLTVRNRTRGRFALLGALLLALLLQGTTMIVFGIPEGRTVMLSPSLTLAALTVKCHVLPVAGIDAAKAVGIELLGQMAHGTFWRWSPLCLLPMALLWTAVLRSRSHEAVALLACGHVMALTAIIGGLGEKLGLLDGAAMGRYFVCINALHALAAIEALRRGWRSWSGAVLIVFLGGTLVQGGHEYLTRDPAMRGADWRTEVSTWRQDPAHPIAVWPDGWFLHLQPR